MNSPTSANVSVTLSNVIRDPLLLSSLTCSSSSSSSVGSLADDDFSSSLSRSSVSYFKFFTS